MGYIKRKDSFENLPEECSDESGNDGAFCVNLNFGNEFIQGKKDEKRQGKRKKILEKKVIYEGDRFGINMVGDIGAFLDGPVDGRPNGCDRQGDQHDNSDEEHDHVFHHTIVKKRFLKVGFEYKINGIDEPGKQKTRGNEGSDESEQSQVCDILRKSLKIQKK
jgi:hypothetical protein